MKLVFIFILITCLKCTLATLRVCDTLQVVSLHKNKVRLLCSVPEESTVSWINPLGELVVSENSVSPKFKKWVDIYGSKQSGEHHLMLKYAVFPDHMGVWLCIAGFPVLKTFATNLTLLVPPAEMRPSITTEELLSSFDNQVFIITCTGHYAFPPVTLSWNRKSGPQVECEINLPKYVTSRTGLVSVSLELILTERHAGSIFECVSQHATITTNYASLFHFNISVRHASVRHHELTTQTIPLSSIDKSFLLIFIVFVLFCSLVFLLLYKLKHLWRWREFVDVPDDMSDGCLNSKSQTNSPGPSSTSEPNQNHNLLRIKISFFFQSMMLLLLVMMLPIYYKGMEAPFSPDTDHIIAVFMGSSLWLDCRNLFHIDNLIRVRWSHNGEIFYNQHFTNNKYNGFPQNNSVGFQKLMRLSSTTVGQIIIWPLISEQDDGIYSCQVLLATQQIKSISTKVHVLTSPSANYVLVGLLSLSICCSIFILLLLLLNCIKLLPRKKRTTSNF